MAAEDPSDIPKLTGFWKYFNSYTVQGKANITKATYGGLLLIFLYFKFRPSKGGPTESKN